MSRTSGITLYANCAGRSCTSLLLEFLKRNSAIFTHEDVIYAYEEDDQDFGRNPFDVKCREEDSHEVLYKMLESGEIRSFDVEIPIAEKAIYFNCDPSYENALHITILANPVLQDDGMIDFNWYYNFWKQVFTGHSYINRVELHNIVS